MTLPNIYKQEEVNFDLGLKNALLFHAECSGGALIAEWSRFPISE